MLCAKLHVHALDIQILLKPDFGSLSFAHTRIISLIVSNSLYNGTFGFEQDCFSPCLTHKALCICLLGLVELFL